MDDREGWREKVIARHDDDDDDDVLPHICPFYSKSCFEDVSLSIYIYIYIYIYITTVYGFHYLT